MAKATSDIGEHTAEFVIVPVLNQLLSKVYDSVTPIYPWISREGSNISLELHSRDKFKVVGLYPRRPKLYSGNSEK